MTAPIALATIDNLTTEYYVPQNEHLQFLLYLAINPYDHGLSSYEPFTVLYRLLRLHNPRLFAGGIPSHPSASSYRTFPLSSSTNNGNDNTLEHQQDDVPSWLTWEKGRSLLHRNVYKYMKRCKDQGIWALLWMDPAKENRLADRARRAMKAREGIGNTIKVKEKFREPRQPQSPKRDGDEEEDDGNQPPENVVDAELGIDLDLEQELEHGDERAKPLTTQGWLLLEWLVAMWEKDEMVRRGPYENPQLEWSPIFLRQLARPYDRTGQMQWSDADMVMRILKAAFAEPLPEEDKGEDEAEDNDDDNDMEIEEDKETRITREEAKITKKLKREEGKEMLARKRFTAVRLFRLLFDTVIAPLPAPPSSNPPSRPPSSSPGLDTGPSTSPFPSSPGIGNGPVTRMNTAAPTPTTPMSNPSSPSDSTPSVHPPFNPPSLTSSLIHTLAPLPLSSLQSFFMLLIPSPFLSRPPSFSFSHDIDIKTPPAGAAPDATTTLPPLPLAPITHIITLLLENFAGTSRQKGEERRERRRRRLQELDFEPGYNGLGRPTVGYLCSEVLALVPPLSAPAPKGRNGRDKKGKGVKPKVNMEKGTEEEGQDEKVGMKMAHLKLVLLQILLRQEGTGEKAYLSEQVGLETLRSEKEWRRNVEKSFMVSETMRDEDPESSTALMRVGRMVLLSVDRLVGV
ncbi:hypothetical protein D1P53_004308 [Cryptococcus gattii VGV]|nr:hypothetical protein D1P53_004308 [Cryptococcus gattii VGV]